MTQTMTEVAQFLQTNGGWGVAVVFLGLLVYVYRSMNNLLEKRNEQFIETLKETTKALSDNSDDSKRIEAVIMRVERLLDK
jgi:Na+-transporting methylmalonyl-CoA/oxaloacetate decarboxylase gamma subunit